MLSALNIIPSSVHNNKTNNTKLKHKTHIKHHNGCRTKSCDHRIDIIWSKLHRPKCSNSNPQACVEEVITQQNIVGQEREWLLRIPKCESGWDPLQIYPSTHADTERLQQQAINSDIPAGLFQFKYSTWKSTPYAKFSIFLAKWQARAAAYVYKRDGGGSEWECQ